MLHNSIEYQLWEVERQPKTDLDQIFEQQLI